MFGRYINAHLLSFLKSEDFILRYTNVHFIIIYSFLCTLAAYKNQVHKNVTLSPGFLHTSRLRHISYSMSQFSSNYPAKLASAVYIG